MKKLHKITVETLDGLSYELRAAEYKIEDGFLHLIHAPETGDVELVSFNARQINSFSVKTLKEVPDDPQG